MIKAWLSLLSLIFDVFGVSMLLMPNSLKPIVEKPSISQRERDTGKIYDTPNFNDGVYFIEQFQQQNPGKKVAAKLDVDNTLLTYTHTLGTDHWFDEMFKQLMAQGLTVEQAKSQLLPLYLEVVRHLHPEDIQLIEADVPEVIRRLQERGVDVLALTSRGSLILEQTLEHLKKFKINLNQGRYAGKEKSLPQSGEGLFTQGMILTGGKHKGQCMLSALEDFGDLPDLVVMWDDKLENLERVRNSICAYNERKMNTPGFVPVQFVGIRYSRLDHVIQNVDSNVAEIQKRFFKRILTNDAAQAIHKAEQKKKRKNYVGINYQPQLNQVTVAVSKHDNYLQLQKVYPDLDSLEGKGTTREVGGKKKLARQFVFTLKQFADGYLAIRDLGLIEPAEVAVLDVSFSSPLPRITPQFAAASAAAREAAANDEAQMRLAELSITGNAVPKKGY